MRNQTIEKMAAIVGSERDPLSVVVGFVLDEELDVQTRMSAASIALPYLYPRLSATTVDARMTVTKVDSADLLRRLDERLAKLAQPTTIEVEPEEQQLGITVTPDEAKN